MVTDLRDVDQILATLSWKGGNAPLVSSGVKRTLHQRITMKLHRLSGRHSEVKRLADALDDQIFQDLYCHPYIVSDLLGVSSLSENDFLYYVASVCAEQKTSCSIEPEVNVSLKRKSSMPIPMMDRGGNDLADNDTSECKTVIGKFSLAHQCIIDFLPEAANLVEGFVWNLFFLKELSALSSLSSGTFHSLPGLVLICNAHLEKIMPIQIEEALIHEAIHCYLFILEANGPPLLINDNTWMQKIVSPWSGATIGVHSAIHAGFVWHGLRQYWNVRSKSSSEGVRRYALDRIDFIEKGTKSPFFKEFAQGIRAVSHNDCVNSVNAMIEDLHRAC